jgi:hypothetical protein
MVVETRQTDPTSIPVSIAITIRVDTDRVMLDGISSVWLWFHWARIAVSASLPRATKDPAEKSTTRSIAKR